MKRIIAMLMLTMFVCGEAAAAMDAFKFGGALRLRQEYWQDVFDMNKDLAKDENFIRFKTTLFGQYTCPKTGSVLYLRLANEMRYYMLSNSAANQESTGGKVYDMDEGVIDNLYFEKKGLFDGKIDLKLGRQDFLGTYGEGFLIMDGTPVDGSRTFYFNAAKATYKINPSNSIDFIYLVNLAKDKMLLFDNQRAARATNTSDEQAGIIYGKLKLNDSVSFEPYFMNKIEFTAPNLNVNTFGARIVDTINPSWKVRGELAMQSGEYDNAAKTKMAAMGGYAYATRSFKETKYSPEIEVGLTYLTGDDVTTPDTVEAWDPLFSRFPSLSELYLLSYLSETGIIGYFSNLTMIKIPQVKLQFTKDTSMSVSYNLLTANQNIASAKTMFSNDGKDRGQMLIANVKHAINKNLSGYLWVERFTPGNFYTSSVAPGPATFVRWQIEQKF